MTDWTKVNSDDDDWKGWVNGKYDNRYDGISRRQKSIPSKRSIFFTAFLLVIVSGAIYSYFTPPETTTIKVIENTQVITETKLPTTITKVETREIQQDTREIIVSTKSLEQEPEGVSSHTPDNNFLSFVNDNIITYSVQEIPNVPDKNLIKAALSNAIQSWETNNPTLEYTEVTDSSPDFKIIWKTIADKDHLGLATTGGYGPDVLEIGLGSYNCRGEYVQHDRDMLSNTIMHEMGHQLGLKHYPDENHLMFGDDVISTRNFDTLGLNIPTRNDDYYVGQNQLLNKLSSLNSQIDSRTKISDELNSQLDVLAVKLSKYPTVIQDPNEYQKAVKLSNEYNSLVSEYNSYIAVTNEFVEQTQILAAELNCFPNVEGN